jgi:hypothetical protein
MIKKLFNKLMGRKESTKTIKITNLNTFTLPAGYSVNTKLWTTRDEENIKIQKEILNSFDNNVTVIYEEIKKYIYDGWYHHNSHIEVCKILDKHLKTNKFNNKLEDIINE